MMKARCASCGVYTCSGSDKEALPTHCPGHQTEWLTRVKAAYPAEQGNIDLAKAAAQTEKEGYGTWTRLQEIAELCHKMGYRCLGLAFCTGLRREASIAAHYYEQAGLEVISAICQCGSISKEQIGIPEEAKFRPGEHESMCNPIGQAFIMNEAQTDFNVVLGLCVGHDSLFFRYAEAPCTVLAAKDRVLGHNPLAAVYLAHSYYRKIFS